MAAADIAEDKCPHMSKFLTIENLAKEANFEHLVILRANFYVQNLLLYKDQMKNGSIPLPINDGKFAPADLLDVGEAAAILSSNPKKLKECSGKLLTITGPTALSGGDIAKHFTKALGREFKFDNISNEEALKILSEVKVK